MTKKINLEYVAIALLLIIVALCLMNENRFIIFTACVFVLFAIMYIVFAANEYFNFVDFCN